MDTIEIKIANSYDKDILCDFYERLKEEKRLNIFLYSDNSLYNFLNIFHKQWVYIPYVNNKPAGFTAFNDFIGKNAFFHFCMFKGFEAYTVDAGKLIFKTVFENGDLENIFGLTPIRYKHVFPILHSVGMRELYTANNSCLVHNKLCAGVFSVISRETFLRGLNNENL